MSLRAHFASTCLRILLFVAQSFPQKGMLSPIHAVHVLYILLSGKWDPISLFDDNDLWISSQSFVNATSHAVAAAEAINDILEYDPDLSFMPFFFGIYLLQGSFLLLLIADKLKEAASPAVVRACETVVRAHEACVVTLNTEYQRNFRKGRTSFLSTSSTNVILGAVRNVLEMYTPQRSFFAGIYY